MAENFLLGCVRGATGPMGQTGPKGATGATGATGNLTLTQVQSGFKLDHRHFRNPIHATIRNTTSAAAALDLGDGLYVKVEYEMVPGQTQQYGTIASGNNVIFALASKGNVDLGKQDYMFPSNQSFPGQFDTYAKPGTITLPAQYREYYFKYNLSLGTVRK